MQVPANFQITQMLPPMVAPSPMVMRPKMVALEVDNHIVFSIGWRGIPMMGFPVRQKGNSWHPM